MISLTAFGLSMADRRPIGSVAIEGERAAQDKPRLPCNPCHSELSRSRNAADEGGEAGPSIPWQHPRFRSGMSRLRST